MRGRPCLRRAPDCCVPRRVSPRPRRRCAAAERARRPACRASLGHVLLARASSPPSASTARCAAASTRTSSPCSGDPRDIVAARAGLRHRGSDRSPASSNSTRREVLQVAGDRPAGLAAVLRRRRRARAAAGRAAGQGRDGPQALPQRARRSRVVEREPFALWQNHGEVFVVSVDGTVIDRLDDARFAGFRWWWARAPTPRPMAFAKLLEAAARAAGACARRHAGRRAPLDAEAGQRRRREAARGGRRRRPSRRLAALMQRPEDPRPGRALHRPAPCPTGWCCASARRPPTARAETLKARPKASQGERDVSHRQPEPHAAPEAAVAAQERHAVRARRRHQQGRLPRRPARPGRPRATCCAGRTHRARIIGIGHQRSRGLKGGAIVDLEARRAGDPPRGRRGRAHGQGRDPRRDRQHDRRPARLAVLPRRRRAARPRGDATATSIACWKPPA